jgi:4-hydroxythreonine-4-phosphate dehydrogenase
VLLHGERPALRCHRRTPAHGTAYDIAGQGIASIGASRAALLLAAEMAARRAA